MISNSNLTSKLNSNWILVESDINVYPSEVGTLVNVTTNIPSNAKEVLIQHNVLGDILLTRLYAGVTSSYYFDNYYRISAWFEWSAINTINYKINSIGVSESYASHGVRYVWYR